MRSNRKATMCDLAYTERSLKSAQWLRDTAYPGPHKAKRIASDWKCSVSLAKQWLSYGPGPRWIDAMAARWGLPFFQFVYVATSGQGAPFVRIQELEEKQSALAAEIGELRREYGLGSDLEVSRGAVAKARGEALGPVAAAQEPRGPSVPSSMGAGR